MGFGYETQLVKFKRTEKEIQCIGQLQTEIDFDS